MSEESISGEYYSVCHLSGPFFEVRKGENYGVFSADKQEMVVPAVYKALEQLSNILCCVIKNAKGGKYYKKYGVLSLETGAFVLPLEYDRMSPFHGSFFARVE